MHRVGKKSTELCPEHLQVVDAYVAPESSKIAVSGLPQVVLAGLLSVLGPVQSFLAEDASTTSIWAAPGSQFQLLVGIFVSSVFTIPTSFPPMVYITTTWCTDILIFVFPAERNDMLYLLLIVSSVFKISTSFPPMVYIRTTWNIYLSSQA